MAKEKPKRRIVNWPLDRLHPHFRQAELFGDLTDVELEELAADMGRNGLLHEVEVLPDGTIVAGHQRVRAAKKLGWTKIRCWVRADLAEAGEKAVELRLIQDNVNRRQLGLVGQVRCYVRLKELLQDGRSTHNLPVGDVRDQLAERFGRSGRTLDRWARILQAPIEVQQAVDAGQVPIVAASKVAGLPKGDQQRIAKRIRKGHDPNVVVKEHLARNGEADSPSDWWLFQCFLRNLKQNIERLGPHHKSMDMILVKKPDLAVLQGGQELLAGLIWKVAEEFERRQQEQEKLQKARDEVWAAFTEES